MIIVIVYFVKDVISWRYLKKSVSSKEMRDRGVLDPWYGT